MTTPQEKAQCVSWSIESKSDLQTRRNFRIKYGTDPSSRPLIRAWHKRSMERQRQCSIMGGVDDQEHRRCKKSSTVLMQLMVSIQRPKKKRNLNIYTSNFVAISTYLSFHLPL